MSKNMMRVSLALSLALIGLVSTASAQFNPGELSGFGAKDTPKVFASAVVREGNPPRLEITAEIEPGWHIYSITQPEGGPKQSKLELDASQQYQLGGKFVADPKPHVKKADIWPDVPIEEHEGKVVWTAPLKLAPGVAAKDVKVSGKLIVQACDPSSCLDQTVPFTSEYTAEAAPQPSAERPVGEQQPIQPNRAAGEGQTKFSKESVTLTGRVTQASVQPGDRLELRVTATPESGYHIYALETETTPKGVSMPAQFALTDRGGLLAAAPEADQPFVEKPLDYAPGSVDRYYQGPVTWTIPLTVPEDAAPGMHLLQGVVGYQACTDDGQRCSRPTGAEFAVDLYVGEAPAGAGGEVLFAEMPFGEARLAATEARNRGYDSVAASNPAEVAKAPVVGDKKKATLTMSLALPLAFLGGFILNFMPCVLPVIGLKVMSFVNQAGQSRGRVLYLNLWYVLGLISVFMVLACMAAFLNYRWAEQFQTPQFAVALACIVFVFALSMLGVWEIPIPGFVGSGKAADMANQEGPGGAFFKGVLTTILATPCVGPFVVPVISWAAKESQATTFLVFFLMGLGMASPYILLGMFPSAVKLMPKPGAWMDTFKHAMGFVLLFTVAYLFDSIKNEWRVPTLALLFALWAGCWWIGRVSLTEPFGRKLRAWATGAAFAAIVGFSTFSAYAFLHNYNKEVWRPFTSETFAELRSSNTPTLIDFTATWCATCQVNKKFSLYTETTETFMREHGVVGLKADKSFASPEIEKLLAELGNTEGGIPFYAVYPNDGGPPILMDGILYQEKLLGAMKQAVGETEQPIQTATTKDARTAMVGN